MSSKSVTSLAMAVIWMLYPLASARSALPQSCNYWVAPSPAGNDSHPGTFDQPWATLDHASAQVLARGGTDCIVWFKDGIYVGTHDLHERFTTPITFKAFNPYRAILQYSGIVIEVSGGRNIILEGFEIRHMGPSADPLLVYVSRSDDGWAEHITFRNNILHDSYNNDLLKIYNGASFVTVEENIFYNAGPGEDHMDVNSVTDVTIQDNIFFNDYAGSGRSDPGDTKMFITVKDSNENDDGLLGSERIAIRRNVFLNWQGGRETFMQIGNDGKPYHEAKDVRIENNLLVGNSPDEVYAALGVRGAKNVAFTNNTVVGDLPSSAYAFWVALKESNPINQNIVFRNNIWSDPTGTMGADLSGDDNDFSTGDPAQTSNLVLDNNLYWNGGAEIPPGEVASPLVHDARRVVADPQLGSQIDPVILPRWNGSTFLSGNVSIRQEFERLVESYGAIPPGSPAIGRADPAFAPADDILGRARLDGPELGAAEYDLALTGYTALTTAWVHWSDPRVPNAASLAISYTVGTTSTLVADIPTAARAYTLTDLMPYSFYTVTLTARDGSQAILARSNALVVLTTDLHVYLPVIMKHGQ